MKHILIVLTIILAGCNQEQNSPRENCFDGIVYRENLIDNIWVETNKRCMSSDEYKERVQKNRLAEIYDGEFR